MAFNADMRKEKSDAAKATDKKTKAEGKLDEALKATFPASDPVAAETPVTGSRARKPELPSTD